MATDEAGATTVELSNAEVTEALKISLVDLLVCSEKWLVSLRLDTRETQGMGTALGLGVANSDSSLAEANALNAADGRPTIMLGSTKSIRDSELSENK